MDPGLRMMLLYSYLMQHRSWIVDDASTPARRAPHGPRRPTLGPARTPRPSGECAPEHPWRAHEAGEAETEEGAEWQSDDQACDRHPIGAGRSSIPARISCRGGPPSSASPTRCGGSDARALATRIQRGTECDRGCRGDLRAGLENDPTLCHTATLSPALVPTVRCLWYTGDMG